MKGRIAVAVFLLLILLAGLGYLRCWDVVFAREREGYRQNSPDGRYEARLLALPHFSLTPGSGSDGPAIVELRRTSGAVVARRRLEMVQLAEFEWEANQFSYQRMKPGIPLP